MPTSIAVAISGRFACSAMFSGSASRAFTNLCKGSVCASGRDTINIAIKCTLLLSFGQLESTVCLFAGQDLAMHVSSGATTRCRSTGTRVEALGARPQMRSGWHPGSSST